VVNSTIYGGAGGAVAVFSRAPAANEIALHELGHSAFGLADEYESYAGCASGETTQNRYTGTEPPEPNVTINTNRTTNKWRQFVAASTAMPTTTNADCTKCDPQASPVPARTVGTFEGGRFFHCGIWRPEFNCRMRTLGQPFCAVCQDRIRRTLAPYMASWTWGLNTLAPGQTQRWWFWWPGYPGLEVIGVQPVTAGAEIRFATPGMQMNSDGSTTYYLTVTNTGAMSVQYHFRGGTI
jgi:IgA peptidase M64